MRRGVFVQVTCEVCEGEGYFKRDGDIEFCPECFGLGFVTKFDFDDEEDEDDDL